MCGIVGYVGPPGAFDVVVEGLRRLEYRGYDSAGVAVWPRGRCSSPSRPASSAISTSQLREQPLPRTVERDRAHPLGDPRRAHRRERPPARLRHGRLAVVHNGIIEHHVALRAS